MFDIGWAEMAVIGVIALIVIGPRDLPRTLYTLGRWAGKARGLLRDLQQGMEDIAREAELEDMKKKFDATRKLDVRREIGNAIDPDGQMAKALDPTANSDGAVPRSSPEAEEEEEEPPVAARRPVETPVAADPPERERPAEEDADHSIRPATPS